MVNAIKTHCLFNKEHSLFVTVELGTLPRGPGLSDLIFVFFHHSFFFRTRILFALTNIRTLFFFQIKEHCKYQMRIDVLAHMYLIFLFLLNSVDKYEECFQIYGFRKALAVQIYRSRIPLTFGRMAGSRAGRTYRQTDTDGRTDGPNFRANRCANPIPWQNGTRIGPMRAP